MDNLETDKFEINNIRQSRHTDKFGIKNEQSGNTDKFGIKNIIQSRYTDKFGIKYRQSRHTDKFGIKNGQSRNTDSIRNQEWTIQRHGQL